MSFSVGIVGLPNVGKSTLFKALTKKQIEIAPRPFTTISPNVGRVSVPDIRLEKLAKIIKPEKVTPTHIEFVDIAGLVKGAHKGEGLGNQFLGHIRNCDAILEVVRGFKDPSVENILGEINPEKEIEILETELLMKDLDTLEILISKLDKKKDKINEKKIRILNKIKGFVSEGKLISTAELSDEERTQIQEYQFLTLKPIFYLLNTNNKVSLSQGIRHITMNLKEEEEISELSEEEQKELKVSSHVDRVIASCYNFLDLITFFTVTGLKETKAWTLKRRSNILEAAKKIHSDFEEKFIKGQVVHWEQLVKIGSWSQARELGQIKIVGKEYIVQDGDVIEFKI